MSDARPADRTWLHGLLFVLTVLTACFAGLGWSASYLAFGAGAPGTDIAAGAAGALRDPRVFPLSALYAAVLMAILVGHELGHYLTCRRYGIAATLPYFLPGPPFIGTFGAFIRIKSRIHFRRQIFDVGANGPLVGFALALPALAAGLAFSRTAPFAPSAGTITFGEPLAFRLLASLFFGRVPEGEALVLHPVGFAGWVGLLVTAINLMPLGQLDGGHIAYALLGPRARYLSFATIGVLAVLGVFFHVTWLLIAGLLLFFEFRSKLRLNHPPVVDEGAPLGWKRRVLSAVVAAVFVLSFIPDPIQGAGLIDILSGKW
ncbi:MAG TPA: site-2 protease family protein [Candidatus Aminicenantes bacterium]|nr:site-2 protease family protein [Candidatus Aminicenantes bacterium]